MTVRRRLLGSSAVFVASVVFVTSVRAQPGRNTGDPTTDAIKARLEAFLNRNRGGGGEGPPFPNGISPEQLQRLAEIAKELGINPGAGGKLNPEQLKQLSEKLKADPRFKGMKENGGPPPFEFNPDNAKRPNPPIDGKGGPATFKDGGPFKLPPDKVTPRPMPQPPPDMPVFPNKNGQRPDGPKRPDLQLPDLQPGPKDQGVELPPWQKPESPQDKARQAVAAMWEKSVGPLDETPAVKKALFDIVDGTGDLKGPDGEGLWDSLTKDLGEGKGFGDLFNGLDTSGDWNLGNTDWSFPKLNWNFNWGNSRPPDIGSAGPARESWFSRWRRSPSSSSSSTSSGSSWFSGWKAPRWNIGMPSLDGTWWPLLFVIAALVGGVFLWKWFARRGIDPMRIDPYALGPWPVDPHHLRTRQDVVIAFEHLSVLLCGEVAKTWTHTTIAGALSELAMAEPQRAMMLARLYELARYTPIEEPLTTAELAEARRLVCRLAGFTDD